MIRAASIAMSAILAAGLVACGKTDSPPVDAGADGAAEPPDGAPDTAPPGPNEGTLAAPVGLTLGQAKAGKVAFGVRDTSVYAFTTDDAGDYFVRLTLPKPAPLIVSLGIIGGDAGGILTASACGNVYFGGDCLLRHPEEALGGCNLDGGARYVLTVRNPVDTDVTYTIEVARGAGVGSFAQPVTIPADGAPVTLKAAGRDPADPNNGCRGVSYYRFTTGDAAGDYLATYAAPADVSFSLWTLNMPINMPPTLVTETAECPPGRAACLINAAPANFDPGVPVVISLRNHGAEAVSFSATLAPGPGVGSRAANAVLPLATEIDARTGDGVFAHYTVTAAAPMPFAVGHLDPSAAGEVHYDLFAMGLYHMTHDSCSLDGSAKNSVCVLVPLGPQAGRMYSLQAQGQLPAAATYKLVVAHAPYQPGAPIEVTVGTPLVVGMGAARGPHGAAHLKFTTGAFGSHRIALARKQSSVGWRLYGDAAFTAEVAACDGAGSGRADVACDVSLTGVTTYYLKLQELDDVATMATVTITR